MSQQYQFTNSSNWSSLWSQEYNAEPVPQRLERFYPIGTVTPGLLLSSPIIAVYCANNQAKENWRYGARYLIKIFTGITVNGGTPETVVKVGKIYLNQIEIIQIPEYSSSFSIDVEVPYWHRNFRLNIWEYIGDNQNTIDSKLDQLLANTSP